VKKKQPLTLALVSMAATAAAQEPAPRRLTQLPMQLSAEFTTISGARELRDGRVLLSDAKRAAVFLVDPKTGTESQVGSAGGGDTQYAQPGGFYSGLADTVYLLDRGQARYLVLTPSGAIVASRSIKRKGVTSSSDLDQDLQQVDARGLSYFVNRGGLLAALTGNAIASDSTALVRFDATRQHYDTVAMLRQTDKKVIQVSPQMQVTRGVHGSPEDGWGIASDGSVAVVRAAPYRVDRYSATGRVQRGSVIAVEPIPFTEAEKKAITAANSRSAPSASVSGGPASPTDVETLFAPTKSPIDPKAVIVSPEGRVWVARSRPADASTVIYDVFDHRGERVDRVELPARNKVIGFGPAAVYAIERDERGKPSLRKYKL
jgi:hypothetical protein